MSEMQDKAKRRAANIRLAIILALIALGFYVAFVLVGLPGG